MKIKIERHVISILLSLCLILSGAFAIPAVGTAGNLIWGDMNKDGIVDITDVMEACKIIARKSMGTKPTEDEIASGDLDGDKDISIVDVMEICKIIARKSSEPSIIASQKSVDIYWNGIGVVDLKVNNFSSDMELYTEVVSESTANVVGREEFVAENNTITLYVAGFNEGDAVWRVGIKNKSNGQIYDYTEISFHHKSANIKDLPIPLEYIVDKSTLEEYLSVTYAVLWTDIGDIGLEFAINENTSDNWSYDYWITIDYTNFSPYNLEHSIVYTQSQKDNTIHKLKQLQTQIYNIISNRMPNKKVVCNYYHGYYKYPNIQEGYTSTQFLTWANYSTKNPLELFVGSYYDSSISDFRWDSTYDDYNF